MHRILLSIATAAAGLFLAGSASALSCLPPTMSNSFHQFNDAAEMYRAVVGEFRPLQPVPSTSGYEHQGGPLPNVRFEFIGREIGFSGPKGDFRRWNVTAQPQCAGPWCAGYPNAGDRVIAFIEDVNLNQSNLRFEDGPCGGSAFQATNSNLNQLVSCLNGRDCPRDNNFFPVEPPSPVDQCGAQGPLAEYIGERVERVPFDLYPRNIRFLRPGDMATMDLRPDRLNVALSNRAIITGLSCG